VTDYGSFRDPAGSVFSAGGKIFRSVFPPGVKDYEDARQKNVFLKLIAAGFLIDHQEVRIPKGAPEGTVYCLEHPVLPFVSYPWEWPFSLFKDAALLQLDIMEMLIPQGFWLRDASVFNVQYDGSGLKLIDTLSIGKRVPDSPWMAYGQFCAHFLAPLVMAAYSDIRLLNLWRNFIDGFPLDLAVSSLSWKNRLRPGLFMHLVLHAYFQKNVQRREKLTHGSSFKNPKATDRGLLGLVRSLRRTISHIAFRNISGMWKDYETYRIYNTNEIQAKTEFLTRVMDRVQPKTVWDLGANVGEFSQTAGSRGAFVVSIEQDPVCTEMIYQSNKRQTAQNRILPLTMDIANPSPGLGWSGRERLSLQERGPADLLLALALIHHLVLSAYVPLNRVARWFSEIAKSVVVEFVPPEDPMVLKLLSNRHTGHLPYDAMVFREAFDSLFDRVDETQLTNGRILIWYRRL